MTNEIENTSHTSTGISPAVSVLLIYLFGWVSGLIFILIEKQNRSVRFHAIQCIVLNVALLAVLIVMQIGALVPFLGFIFSLVAIPLVGLGTFVLILIIVVKKFQGSDVRLPILGDMAEKVLNSL